MLKDFVREKKTIQPSVTEPTIVLKGKTSQGFLDRYLMQEIRRKFSQVSLGLLTCQKCHQKQIADISVSDERLQMKSNMRDMFHILDPANEGRIR